MIKSPTFGRSLPGGFNLFSSDLLLLASAKPQSRKADTRQRVSVIMQDRETRTEHAMKSQKPIATCIT